MMVHRRFLGLMRLITQKMRMEGNLKSLRFGVWQSFKSGYTIPTTPITDPTKIRLYECNAKSKNAILCGLADL